MTNDDLRTALTKLADKWLSNKDRPSDYQDGVADAACAIRALLAAHPAEVVSDTRREDDELVEAVARALQEHANSLARDLEWGEGVPFEDLAPHMQDARRGQARAVLAVLPAPPVVGETLALEEAADDMEAVIALGDAAESTAVPAGTTGVGSAIGARDALYEDPVAWLRDRAARLRGESRG
ncbi:hypothetical protein [Oerskovia enterophila]|uniref:hypothetical protein n=1 Tax=Oerskovia enterophila TaxID=43678 RepID=UPI00382BA830